MPSNLAKLMSIFSDEIDRFNDSVNTIVKEAVPGLSTETLLLTDWETEAGLPNPCMLLAVPNPTESQRRGSVHALLTGNYTGMSKQFYVDLAAKLGCTVTIETGGSVGTPFRTGGASTPGTTRVGANVNPMTDPDSYRLWSATRLHTWIVRVASSEQNIEAMKCLFQKMKPAWTVVQFIEY